jgi:hypothetical protein
MGPSNVKLIASLFVSPFHSRSIRVLFCSTTTHFRFTRLEPGWNADGLRMERGWNADGTRMERGWNADGTRMERGTRIGTRMERGWNADWTKILPTKVP